MREGPWKGVEELFQVLGVKNVDNGRLPIYEKNSVLCIGQGITFH